MARITVEDCLTHVDNRFALCLLTVKRGRQLMSRAKALVEVSPEKAEKPPVTSLREIATGRVKFDRSVRDALSGKFDAPKGEVKLVPAGTGKSAATTPAPSGGLF
jgi:DNA-directed RNA polymerase subunit omega